MFWQGLKYHQLQANKDAVSTCILRNKPGRYVIINSKKFRSGGKTSAEAQTTFRGEMRQAVVFFLQMDCEFITNNFPTRCHLHFVKSLWQFASIPFYSRVERDVVEAKCLVHGQMRMTLVNNSHEIRAGYLLRKRLLAFIRHNVSERNEIKLVFLVNLLVKCLLLVYCTLGFTALLVSWELIRFLFLKVLQVYHDQDNDTLVTKCRYPKIVIHIWSLPLLQLMRKIDCDADMTCFTRMVWSETLC